MDYTYTSIWDVIKRFMIGWAVGGGILVFISCVKYWDFITTAFANNAWFWFDSFMPVIIIILGVWYIIKSLFK